MKRPSTESLLDELRAAHTEVELRELVVLVETGRRVSELPLKVRRELYNTIGKHRRFL